ncbi:hypothetical protein EOL96_02235 [Candidatus Saccharibacteria bacterium]|nr:hypothetical protein [Candidatus Saccharibacteria bacterium]
MTRKQAEPEVETKPSFNPLRSLRNAGVSVGYLVLGLVILVLAPFLWVFLLSKGVRDAIRNVFQARAQKRIARRQKAAKKA